MCAARFIGFEPRDGVSGRNDANAARGYRLARTNELVHLVEPGEVVRQWRQGRERLRRPVVVDGRLDGVEGESVSGRMAEAFIKFWKKQRRTGSQWLHPEDEDVLLRERHSFNLAYPVVPYIGNIREARSVILCANAGYSRDETPLAFEGTDSERDCLEQIAIGSTVRWSARVSYYCRVNYGQLLRDGRAVVVNACAYRSVKISEEPDNKRILEHLPSVKFARDWLLNDLLPLARDGQRLVIAKRWVLWENKSALSALVGCGVAFDRCPANPNLTEEAWRTLDRIR